MNENTNKISEKTAQIFGFSWFSVQMLVSILSTYTTFFMTDIIGVTAAAAGTVLLVGGLVDTWGIFVIGGVVNNTNMKWGKYRSWIFFVVPILALSYFLFYRNWNPSMASTAIILIILYSVYMTAGNFLTIVSNGLAAVMGKNVEGRTILSARMMQYNQIARFIAGTVFLWFVATVGNGNAAKGYSAYIIIASIIILAAYLLLAKISKPYDIVNEKTVQASKMTLLDMWRAIKNNDQFLWFMISQIIRSLGIMYSYMAMAYFYRYIIGDLSTMALYNSTSTIAAVVGTLFGPTVWKMMKSKKSLTLWSGLAYGIAFGLCFLIIIFNGTISHITFLIIINIGIILNSLGSVLRTSMFMDCAEYGYYKEGKDPMAFIMSFSNIAFKIALSFGSALAAYTLSAAGYVAGVEITTKVFNAINFIVFGGPAICIIVSSILFAIFYKLTDEKVTEIMDSNEKKKAELLI